MRPETLWRLGAWLATLGGAARIGAALIPYTPQSWPLEALYFLIDVSLLLGLTTIYLRDADALGMSGLAAFGTAFCGLACLAGPDARAFGVDWYQIGAAVTAIGTAGLGLTMLAAKRSMPAAVFWVVTPIVAFTGPPLLAFQAAGMLFGAGFVAAGLQPRQ